MTSQRADSLDREDRLSAALVACLEAIDSGPPVDRAALLARYPEFATELAKFLDDQEQVECRAAPLRRIAGYLPATELGESIPVHKELGDFRIVREVGRGGMGIVYEAEQVSLRRRVALKVLPFAATMDPRHLPRFHNEAQAAACLHHTNIVPVFFVGCERGVHFYAMQFIDGQPLYEIIRQLRGLEKKDAKATKEESTATSQPPPHGASDTGPTADLVNDSTPLTGEGRRGRDYFRKVAELGIQAAEALDHAHQLGIVHRDIKPGNLLLDNRGNLWVTDFGLAQVQSDTRLTRTGDLVGTLRYMSPEQALAKRVVIDHRTDIYALGATLYELLTLQPAFEGEDRQELLRQIAFEEPQAPRRLHNAVPAELDTIVLKAMEKNPAERYGTAQELADDLRLFLQDKPIHAKRPSFAKRILKYLRRHRATAWAAGAGLIVALFILSISSFLLWREKERVKLAFEDKETQARLAEEQTAAAEKQRRRAEANFGEVLNGMTMMLEHLDEKQWPQTVTIEQVRRELERHMEDFFQRFTVENKDESLARLEIGWGYQHLGVFYLRRGDHSRAEQHFRTALAFHEALAADYPDDPASVWMYAQSLDRLGYVLYITGRTEEAHRYFLRTYEQSRRELQMHPDWRAYHAIAGFLVTCPDVRMRDAAEALRAASRAVELAPHILTCRGTLGRAQYRNGDYRAAVVTLENCIRSREGEKSYNCYFLADCFFLAMAYWQLGDREQARRYFERGIHPTGREIAPYVTIQQIRAEAAALLGIPERSTSRDKETSPESD